MLQVILTCKTSPSTKIIIPTEKLFIVVYRYFKTFPQCGHPTLFERGQDNGWQTKFISGTTERERLGGGGGAISYIVVFGLIKDFAIYTTPTYTKT